jgi:pyruvate dehydrogenase E2 component (dihydrolipoamide acetyltransferase)
MAFEFKFPDVGEGIHEGRIVEWLVKEGDTVKVDAPLLKVETDKAVVDLPSPRAGTILKLHVPADAVIHVGQVIVTIGEAGEQITDNRQQAEGLGLKAEEKHQPGARSGPELRTPNSELRTAPSRPLATPRTRALARKLGVDLAAVQGTGKHGRITDEDVQAAAGGRRSEFGVQSSEKMQKPAGGAARSEIRVHSSEKAQQIKKAPFSLLSTLNSQLSTAEGTERVPASYLRKKIAEHMLASKRTSAHVTHVDEADVTALFALYREAKEEYRAKHGFNLTVLPFFMKALVAALREHPIFNAAYDEAAGEIVHHRHVHIGLAADTPEGLVVPVVKHAQAKSILALGAEVAELAAKARERRLALDEMKGATITITNIGPLGGLFATPILNQPNLAILALGEIQDRPVVVDGAVAVRKMIYLSLTFDHRIIDGAEAARFVRDLARILAKPGLLLAGA